MKRKNESIITAALAAIASAGLILPNLAQGGTSTNTAGTVQQGQSDGGTGNPSLNNPAVTISFAGQTALKNFFISPAPTELQPGTSIILHDGTNGAPITYTATNDGNTTLQLASKSFVTPDKNPGTPFSPSTSDVQVASALRVEWKEEGSIDGFYELLNDQVGYVPVSSGGTGPIDNEALLDPSVSNPTIVNQTTFNGASNTSSTGFVLNSTTYNGVTALNQTYNPAIYNQATGTNIQGGQNRVQFAIGEYPTEALAVSGTASPFASVGSAGYGQGNPALQSASLLTALGTAGARQQFQPSTAANESTNKIDPVTGSAYAAGPWNTAGANNITSTPFAVTAVTYSANPATGLQRIDNGDAQWLQTTGRLQNGALFNVVARTVDTGQRVVFALATGVDPSWAVGSNDDGNSTTTANANAQHSIGPSLRFDGKTSGSEAETTISVSRMAVGALSVPEANAAQSYAPVRALDVDFNDQTDVNPADDSTNFVRASLNTIISSGTSDTNPLFRGAAVPHYSATLISHVNTVKAPNQTALNNALTALGINPATATAAQQQTAWTNVQSLDPATAETDSTPSTAAVSVIKVDTYGDVAAVISNVVNSTGTAAQGITVSSANDPADGLLSTGYLIPGLLDYTRQVDGGPITPVTLSSSAQTEQSNASAYYGTLFGTDGVGNSGPAANAETIGGAPGATGASFYGGASNGLSSNGLALNGAIMITAKDSSGNLVGNDTIAPSGNYLFGNFNQNGVRDLSSVKQAVNAVLSLYAIDGAKNSIFTSDGGVTNSTMIPSLYGTPGWVTTGTNTKGDLITLGDYNGDGKFDGADLYLFAIGASLTSSNSTTGLSATAATFSDVVRDPTDVLRKNAALNYINNYLNNPGTYNATAAEALWVRQTAAAVLTTPGVTTAAGVPRNATALNTTDPITGLEQFTYDPNGVNAFNPADVNRDGVVDFNDAVLVDQYNGQSYTNLTQSLAATQQSPVNGVIEPLSLVNVQQVDGESAIGSADLAAINSALTGVGNTNWYGYTFNKSDTGTVVWSRTGGTVTVYSGAAFQISSGTVHVSSSIDPFTDSTATGTETAESVAITVTGGTLEYTGASTSGVQLDRLASLNIASGSVVIDPASNHSNHTLLIVGGLTLGASGKLDLGNSDLDVQAGSLSAVNNAVALGYNNGTWNNSTGITSTSAANSSTHLQALGVIQNNQSGTALFTGSNAFDGIIPGAGDILVKYTYYGDTNLSGTVDGSDYSRIDNGYLDHLTGWYNGDFNYDGVVNGSDYTLIDNAFNTQGASLATELAAPTAQIAGSTTAVPEPLSTTLIGATSLMLLGRRRRRFVSDW
jgi:hypothetical protein